MRIKERMEELQMTQQDLRLQTGLSERQIRALVNGEVGARHVQADTLLRLAKALDMTMEYLMGDSFELDDGRLLYADEFVWFEPTQAEKC